MVVLFRLTFTYFTCEVFMFDISMESLFNWLLGADCKSMQSVTCHEKYTQSFNTPKYPIENVWEKSTGFDGLKVKN